MIRILCFGVFLLWSAGNQMHAETTEIKSLLPQPEEIADWMPEDEYEIAVGEDLYVLINGGAQIYLEYGFNQTIYQTYADKKGNRINLEIYEMSDTAAAYGMYTFKTRTAGQKADLQCEGWISDYYLNFWKGSYVVTLIGMDNNENIKRGLREIARVIESKIVQTARWPQLTTYLPSENITPNGITYIRGTLGLVNQYPFATKNILNCREAVVGTYADYSLFILQYADTTEAQNWFSVSRDYIRTSESYTAFDGNKETSKVTDKKGNVLLFMIHDRWILIYIGVSDRDTFTILESLRFNISN